MKKICIMLFTILLLFACKIDVSTDIFISDILDINTNKDPIFCSAQIKFDSSSNMNEETINALLNKYFKKVQDIHEDKTSYMGSIIADVQIPILKKGTYEDKSIFYIEVDSNDQYYFVNFKINEQLFDQMNSDVSNITYQKFDKNDLNVKFEINNDTKTDIKIGFHSVYINSTPTPYFSEINLERRQKIEIVPSDVLRDSLNIENFITMAFIKR
jgi:hypothetical protein